jgi:two-component system, chemotaxis family, CheB/CheR fusion protein
VGQPVSLLIPPDRLDQEPTVLARIRRGEVVQHFETVRRRKDGTLVDVSVTVSPILDSQGQVVGASKIARDITERKKVAETLLEADRHKNEFLAMLAHELRNPLAPILVSIEILRRAKRLEGAESLELSPRVDHALDVLQRQVGQMVRLVDDLLDAGRISRGKIDLRRERVEVASVVHHAVEAARPIAERRGQELTVALPTVPVYVNADPTRLAQIVGNLLNNACKFTERNGHVWLTVEREQSRPDPAEAASNGLAPQIVISVRDTGIGIAPDRLEGIFDMFTQLDTSLERSLTGLGIGLTLVRTLVEMHGGTVEASSPGIGQGSKFVVRLPIVTEAAIQAPLSSMTEPAVTPLRILIVDDNRDSADMLATLLKFSGHETHTAHDGMAAVEAAIKLDPDVILLDIGLPQLNGYEAARRIREQNSGRGRPVLVALTGWGQDEDRRRSEEAGFDAHVVKPVDHARLHKLLAELGSRNQTVEP